MGRDFSGILKGILKYKYLVLVVLVGIVLILLPTGGEAPKSETGDIPITGTAPFSLKEEERRLEDALGSMEGVGKVKATLSVRGGVEREFVMEENSVLVVSAGSGAQNAVESGFTYPEYLGALIVCEGADDASVRLSVTRAVQSVTGLGSDKITVSKMKKS